MKYTKLERNWVMYDVGNSALVLLNTSVVPIYFNEMCIRDSPVPVGGHRHFDPRVRDVRQPARP